MERFKRNQNTITPDQQTLLSTKTATIVGCGGLGGFVIEELVRIGITKFILIDSDNYEVSNLNRQIYADSESIGSSKCQIAKQRILKINPCCEVIAHQSYLNHLNYPELIKDTDIIFDCVDNVTTKLLLENITDTLAIPLVHGAVAGKYGQVALILPAQRLLHKIYQNNNNGLEKTLGNPCYIVAMVATIQVYLAIQYLLQLPVKTSGFYYLDLDNLEIEFVEVVL